MSNDKSIRSQIKSFGATPEPAKPLNEQAQILAGLNILKVLDEHGAKYLQERLLVYGAQTFAGKDWAKAVIWFRPKGLYSYETLTLFGVWINGIDDANQISIGTKELAFSAPVYNAESYYKLLPEHYQVYYADDNQPPSPNERIYQVDYDITRRLALRQEIKDALISWLRHRAS